LREASFHVLDYVGVLVERMARRERDLIAAAPAI
jgi:hypothetical protein